jgi:hypothetical protein
LMKIFIFTLQRALFLNVIYNQLIFLKKHPKGEFLMNKYSFSTRYLLNQFSVTVYFH